MTMAWARGHVAALIALGAVAGAACGGSATVSTTPQAKPTFSGAAQRIIAAAKQEGSLNLTLTQMIDQQEDSDLIAAFNSYYGTNISVKITPGPQFPQIVAKTVQEYQAKQNSSTDALLVTETHIVTLQQAGAVQSQDWSWAPDIQAAGKAISPDADAIAIFTRIPGITYNTNKLKGSQAPKSLADLLQPQFKGKVATTSYAAGFPYLGSAAAWGKDKTTSFVRQYSAQVGGLINCGEESRVANGEYDAFALDCATFAAQKLQRQGLPVTSVVPTDAALLSYTYMIIPKNSAHANTAMLWINFLVSRQGQDLIYKYEGGDLQVVKGSHSADEVNKALNSGVKFVTADVAFAKDPANKDLSSSFGFSLQQIIQHKA